MERVRNVLRVVSTEIIAGAVVCVLTSVGAGVWAWFSRLEGLYIFLVVIGVLGVSVVGVNQLDGFVQRRKKPLYQQPQRYIDSTLRDWLYRGSFSLRENSQEGFEFAFVARDKQERPIFIGKANDRDEILLQLTLSLKAEETERLGKLDPEVQRKLLSELRISLARHQVQYFGLAMPITRIGILNIMVLDESFTRDVFLDRVDRVRYALVLVLELLAPILDRKVETETTPRIKMDE